MMEDVPKAKPEEKEKKTHKCEQCEIIFECSGTSTKAAGCDCQCGIYRMSSEGWANSHLFFYCSEQCCDDSTRMDTSDEDSEDDRQFKRYCKTLDDRRDRHVHGEFFEKRHPDIKPYESYSFPTSSADGTEIERNEKKCK